MNIKEHQDLCNETRQKLLEAKLEGAWTREPDRVEFKSNGYDCLLLRHPTMFNWRGYVGVPLTHPYVKNLIPRNIKFGKTTLDVLDYGKNDECPLDDVHGGVTYRGTHPVTYRKECDGAICHTTAGENHLLWVGFDCAHLQDLIPGMEYVLVDKSEIGRFQELYSKMPKGTYKDVIYVKKETQSLSDQLKSYSMHA